LAFTIGIDHTFVVKKRPRRLPAITAKGEEKLIKAEVKKRENMKSRAKSAKLSEERRGGASLRGEEARQWKVLKLMEKHAKQR